MSVMRTVPEASSLIELLANQLAEDFINEILIPELSSITRTPATSIADLRKALTPPMNAMRVVLGWYAVSRKGRDRAILSKLVLEALDQTIGESEFEEFLESRDSEALWQSFVEACQKHQRKVMEQSNRPIIEGIATLAFDVYEETGHGNLLTWIADEVRQTHKLAFIFERLTDIRTLGPKIASHLLRDVVVVFDVERYLDFSEWMYTQPISSTVRKIARYVVPEARDAHLPDWVLTGKISKYVRLAGFSGARFNMGCTYISAMAGQGGEYVFQNILDRAVGPQNPTKN